MNKNFLLKKPLNYIDNINQHIIWLGTCQRGSEIKTHVCANLKKKHFQLTEACTLMIFNIASINLKDIILFHFYILRNKKKISLIYKSLCSVNVTTDPFV